MSHDPATDRNLLFGILALQMDFVTRDQLVEAMAAWVLDRTRPLPEVLCRRRALLVPDRHLLEQVVERHLQRHGKDAGRSLATLSVVPEVRQALEALPDTNVQASVGGMRT